MLINNANYLEIPYTGKYLYICSYTTGIFYTMSFLFLILRSKINVEFMGVFHTVVTIFTNVILFKKQPVHTVCRKDIMDRDKLQNEHVDQKTRSVRCRFETASLVYTNVYKAEISTLLGDLLVFRVVSSLINARMLILKIPQIISIILIKLSHYVNFPLVFLLILLFIFIIDSDRILQAYLLIVTRTNHK